LIGGGKSSKASRSRIIEKQAMKLGKIVSQMADRRWRRFYWQRRFMQLETRARTSARIARRRNETPEALANDARTMANELRGGGLVDLGRPLSSAQCAEIRAYFADKDVIDHYRPEHVAFRPHGPERHPDCHVAYHRDEDVLAAPYLLAIANDPAIVAAMHQFFGCRPTISYLAAWWSYPTAVGPQQAENFHRDVDDWSFIKLFVYLTDVDAESGPHVYVRASPASPKLNVIKRFTDEEVIEAFGADALAIQTGEAGTAFLENTFGLHKGMKVEKGLRLIFQAVYSLNPVPYGPARPVARFDDHLTGDAAARQLNSIYLA
jgi:hypothetical protein